MITGKEFRERFDEWIAANQQKYIAFVRHHPCNRDFKDDRYYWKIIESCFLPKTESPIDLEEEYRLSADCDYLGGGSPCDDCGEWIRRVEPYSEERARELGLGKNRLSSNQ
ncbi:MAG: hypothetical protein HZB66_00615 [Candidatus Aenigmarchaeota archaeon]|nr:hypothetical protein [Candidatus Aenigmarchaeota archaeon]